MRRHIVCIALVSVGIGLLAGCGQKGALFMPPPRPNVATPGTATATPPPAPPAPATTAPAVGANADRD